MGRAERWPAQAGQKERGQKSSLRSCKSKRRAGRVSQKTEEQTWAGRELMSRSDENARSDVMFIEFGNMVVKGDLTRPDHFSRAVVAGP